MKTQPFCWVQVIHYITLLELNIYFGVACFNFSGKLNWRGCSFFLRVSNTGAELQYLVNEVLSVQRVDSDWLSLSDLSVDMNS